MLMGILSLSVGKVVRNSGVRKGNLLVMVHLQNALRYPEFYCETDNVQLEYLIELLGIS